MSTEPEVWWLDEQNVVSLHDLLEVSGLREQELLELVHVGVLPARDMGGAITFNARVVTLARTACRLRDDFELDTHALALAMRLLERVRDLEGELARLRAHAGPLAAGQR